MSGFITEIAVVVIIYLILKKYWNTKVKEYFGNFVGTSHPSRFSVGFSDPSLNVDAVLDRWLKGSFLPI